jgi:hypothetical protein
VALLANELVTVRTIKAAVLASAPNAPVASLGRTPARARASWQTVLGPADLAIALVIGAALLYIVHTERRHAAATELLWRAERSNGVLFGLLSLLTLTIARLYLSPGKVFMATPRRTCCAPDVRRALPALRYADLVERVVRRVPAARALRPPLLHRDRAPHHCRRRHSRRHETAALGCHVGSVFTMWWFLREATGRRLAALVGAIAFGLTFHRVHIILFQGDLQVAVVFLLLPVALLLSERFIRRGRIRGGRSSRSRWCSPPPSSTTTATRSSRWCSSASTGWAAWR